MSSRTLLARAMKFNLFEALKFLRCEDDYEELKSLGCNDVGIFATITEEELISVKKYHTS